MKSIVGPLALIVAIFAFGGALAESPPSAEMEKDIRELIELTGSGDMARQIMNQLIAPVKQAMPGVGEEYWTRFVEKIDMDELIDKIVPIYAKHFTHDDIKGIAAFYRTPVGKKMIAKLPAVMQESIAVGQEWGAKLGRQIEEDLKAEGYE